MVSAVNSEGGIPTSLEQETDRYLLGDSTEVGLGAQQASIVICIANRPMIDHYPQIDHLQPLAAGELQHIVANTSNHWRKVFNVFSKFLYQLADSRIGQFPDWQTYRDQQLLQLGCSESLLFSPPSISFDKVAGGGDQISGRLDATIHIIAGKTYAAQLQLRGLIWLDAYFAIHPEAPIIVSPYLDYRQLSNARIEQLVGLVKHIRARDRHEVL